jgi:hypothetical protein
MLFPQCAPASNHHNGYTSGTEDCPFRVEAMPTLPASAIFPRFVDVGWPPSTGKGNGADRWSLVKYNQPRGRSIPCCFSSRTIC